MFGTMASSAQSTASSLELDQSSTKTVPILICSLCKKNLAFAVEQGLKILHTSCGHVFHETCLKISYEFSNIGRPVDHRLYYCPHCMRSTDSDCSRELEFQISIDKDFLALIEKNRKLRIEKEEMMKQKNVLEIKLILFESNKEQIYEKLGNLTWNNLTEEFQIEIRKTIEQKYSALNIHNLDLKFLRTKTLFQLITEHEANKDSTLSNILHDYTDTQTSSNVYITMKDVELLFKKDFLTNLRNASGVPTLDLSYLPVTMDILKMLIHFVTKGYTYKDKEILLIKIANSYLAQFSYSRMNVLYKIALFQLLAEQLNDEIELETPYVNNNIFDELLVTGELKKVNGKIKIVNKLIMSYITGIMTTLAIEKMDMSMANSQQYFFSETIAKDSLDEYCVSQLVNLSSKSLIEDAVTHNLINAFNYSDPDILTMLLLLGVSKLKSSKELKKLMHKLHVLFDQIGKNMFEIEYACVIRDQSIQNLTIPCFVVLRGEVVAFHDIYSFYIMMGQGHRFDFGILMHLCSCWTQFSKHDELQEKMEILSFILMLRSQNFISSKEKSKDTPKTVHFEIVKYIMNNGFHHFREIWNIELMLRECVQYIEKERFCDILAHIYKHDEWAKIVEIYFSVRPISIKC